VHEQVIDPGADLLVEGYQATHTLERCAGPQVPLSVQALRRTRQAQLAVHMRNVQVFTYLDGGEVEVECTAVPNALVKYETNVEKQRVPAVWVHTATWQSSFQQRQLSIT